MPCSLLRLGIITIRMCSGGFLVQGLFHFIDVDCVKPGLVGGECSHVVQRGERNHGHRLEISVLVPAPRHLLVVLVHMRSRLWFRHRNGWRCKSCWPYCLPACWTVMTITPISSWFHLAVAFGASDAVSDAASPLCSFSLRHPLVDPRK